MAKSRYQWLKEEQARAAKNESKSLKELRKQLAVAAGPGLGGSQFIGNTGLGEDGQLQPSNPTQIVGGQQGPTMLHEGEDLIRNPDGSITVKPVGQSQAGQSQLAQIEKQYNIPGMQDGGVIEGEIGEAWPPPEDGASTPVYRRGRGRHNMQLVPGTQDMPAVPALDVGSPITTNPEQRVVTPTLPGQIEQNVGLNIGDPVATSGASGGFKSFQPAGEEGGAPAPATPVAQVGQGDQMFNQSAGILSQVAAGQDPYMDQLRQSERMRLKGEEQAAAGALSQDMSQLGMSGREGLTERAMLQGQFGGQEVESMRGMNEQAAQRQMQAVNNLATVGLQKSQQEYKQKTDAMNAMISAGGADNYAAAATAFQEMYGVPLNTDRLLTAEGRADFETGMEGVSKYIASGLSWDDAYAAMQNDGTFDLLGMDEGTAKTMYENMALNGDPVYQAMNSLSDDTLATMFPDMDPAEARATIGKMHLLGVGSFDADGRFQIDYDMLGSLGLGFEGGPQSGPDVDDRPISERYDSFVETLPADLADEWTFERWEQLDEPGTYDEYRSVDAGDWTDLASSTDGNLMGQDAATLSGVADAILAGDATAVENFGIEDSGIGAMLLFTSSFDKTFDDSHGVDSFMPAGLRSEEAATALVGKVISLDSEAGSIELAKKWFGADYTPEELDKARASWERQLGSQPGSAIVEHVAWENGFLTIRVRNLETGETSELRKNMGVSS